MAVSQSGRWIVTAVIMGQENQYAIGCSDRLISKHRAGWERWERIGQPDYVSPRFLEGSGVWAAVPAVRWGHSVTLHRFLVLSFDFVEERLGWQVGWARGALVQNSDERRRRLSPAQPCVRQRHSNGNQFTRLYPFTSTCAFPQTPVIAAWIFLGWLLTSFSSAWQNKMESRSHSRGAAFLCGVYYRWWSKCKITTVTFVPVPGLWYSKA